jgi:hypothetical protein
LAVFTSLSALYNAGNVVSSDGGDLSHSVSGSGAGKVFAGNRIKLSHQAEAALFIGAFVPGVPTV